MALANIAKKTEAYKPKEKVTYKKVKATVLFNVSKWLHTA